MPDKKLEDYLPFIKSIIAPYRNLGVPYEDLLQEGLWGLWEAMQRYEPERKVKLTTYAAYWIKKRVLEAISQEKKGSMNSTELNEEITAGNEPAVQDSYPDNINLPENMPDDERMVLSLSFNEQFTLKEIAQKLGITREKARQLKEKGMRRLKAHFYEV
ncbi:MAG: sigma-70 family RNA polymerase sigma factor [Candidatus Cloacimonetes bacterium]|nr:sigma-70 family RNA polymerase sigma factor [Candidatus Cloacimonadota bacterium]